jgi:hypothetical protein
MINTQNTNTEVEILQKEFQEYTNRLNTLKSEALRLEGVVLYIQNLLQQKLSK